MHVTYKDGRVVLSRNRKTISSRGTSLVGNLLYSGIAVAMGDTFASIDAPGLSMKDAIFLGKCFAVHSCDFRGVDDSVNDYSGSGAPFDLFMEQLGGPKWRNVHVRRTPDRPSLSSGEFLKGSEVNENVRSVVRSFVPKWHREHYDGSFINTNVTLSGILALRDKMRGVLGDDGKIIQRLNLSPGVWDVSRMVFWDYLGLGSANIPLYMDDETIETNFFRGSAGVGFDSSVQHVCGTKGDNVAINAQRCHWIARELLSGRPPESFLAPWGHITGLKPEVFGPDVPKDKIRFIFQQNMECGSFTKHFTVPIQKYMETRSWYMPGKGLFGEQYPYLLTALSHPDARTFFPDFHPPMAFDHFALFDLSGQDWSYISEVLLLIMSSLMNLMKEPDLKKSFWVNLAGWISAWTVCKIVQCWGNKYKYALGSFASGSDWTTIFDTCEMLLVVLTTIIEMAGLDQLSILSHIRFVKYGDDSAVSMTKFAFDLLFPGGDPSGFIRTAKKCFGAVFKPSQTELLAPLPHHQDRFYTHISRCDGREDVVSPGIRILKRYWVKYNCNLEPLHPDTPLNLVKVVLPWRPCSELVSKIGLDPKNWGSEDQPWVLWYQKAFGLLIDACANLESHKMIMNAMSYIRSIFPLQVSEAESSFSWAATENKWKLGVDFDDTLISVIPRSSRSLILVASLFFTTDVHLMDLFPSGINRSMFHHAHCPI